MNLIGIILLLANATLDASWSLERVPRESLLEETSIPEDSRILEETSILEDYGSGSGIGSGEEPSTSYPTSYPCNGVSPYPCNIIKSIAQ